MLKSGLLAGLGAVAIVLGTVGGASADVFSSKNRKESTSANISSAIPSEQSKDIPLSPKPLSPSRRQSAASVSDEFSVPPAPELLDPASDLIDPTPLLGPPSLASTKHSKHQAQPSNKATSSSSKATTLLPRQTSFQQNKSKSQHFNFRCMNDHQSRTSEGFVLCLGQVNR